MLRKIYGPDPMEFGHSLTSDPLVNATGSTRATIVMVSFLFMISFNCNLASIASVSRLTWAWARDGGLFSYVAYVSELPHYRHLESTRLGSSRVD